MARMTRASRGVGNWVGVVIVLRVERELANFGHLEGIGILSCGVYLGLQFNQDQLGDLSKRTDISGV